jgi:serine/threonine protein kinase
MGPLNPGEVLGGDFEIQRVVAEGGYGVVYLAKQRSLDRDCAIKVLQSRRKVNPKEQESFRKEALRCAKIARETAYIVEIYGSGVEERTVAGGFGMAEIDLVFWLAMEFLEGTNLADELQRVCRFPLTETQLIFKQLCHALQAMHQQGLIHRDLKPDNVFLLKQSRVADERLMVKLLDLGIAKDIRDQESLASSSSVGTPLYMSPEQLETNHEFRFVGPQTDMWALGLIAFELLTGASYWNSTRNPGSNTATLFREILLDSLETPSERAKKLQLARWIPVGFDTWFAKCVCREHEKRFSDVQSLYSEFQTLVDPHDNTISADDIRSNLPAISPRPVVQTPATTNTPYISNINQAQISSQPPGYQIPDSAPRSAPSSNEAPVSATKSAPNSIPISYPSFSSRASEPQSASRAKPKRSWIKILAGIVFIIIALPVGNLMFTAGVLWWDGEFSDTEETESSPGKGFRRTKQEPESALPPPRDRVVHPITSAQITATGCPVQMVLIPAGSFLMGSDEGASDERPAHKVDVGRFCMDKTEVTVAAYKQCVDEKACQQPKAGKGKRREMAFNWGKNDRQNHPINGVDVFDAIAYCKYVGKLLPTEEQWEYAARGTQNRLFPWGNQPPTKQGCWDRSMRSGGSCLSASNPNDQTPEGLFDMGGNMGEWTISKTSDGYSSPRETEIFAQRVVRGGAWSTSNREELTSFFRDHNDPRTRQPDIGFRCAFTP